MNKTTRQLNEISVPAARIEFSPAQRQWIADRIQEVLESGQLTLGKYGEEFEQLFAGFCGSRHAVAVSSGTAALEIIFRCLGVEGRDVLVPTNTNFATVAAVMRAGGKPVLLDCDPASFGIHPDEVRKRMTADTAGFVVVHIGGIVSGQMQELVDLAKERGIWLVEDAAHAHGSSLHGTAAGTFGIAGAFSFYPTKVMTSAEGGMIVTNDEGLMEEARIYRDQGKASFSQNLHVRMGLNWRMSEPHAIIGLSHLDRLPEMIADRQAIARIYDYELGDVKTLSSPKIPDNGICNYYKYIVLPEKKIDRKAIKERLRNEHRVSLTGEVYEVPIHRQPVFEHLADYALPMADDVCARHLCLPVFTGMSEDQAMQVVKAVKAVIQT